jgi:ferredoxin
MGALRAALAGALRSEAPLSRGPPALHYGEGSGGEVEGGQTLLQAAKKVGLDLDHYCGGNCTCGTCRVRILEGADQLSPMSPREKLVLGESAARAGERLACQARVLGPVRVQPPRW